MLFVSTRWHCFFVLAALGGVGKALLWYFVGASVPFGRQSGLPVNPNGFSKGIAKLGQTS